MFVLLYLMICFRAIEAPCPNAFAEFALT